MMRVAEAAWTQGHAVIAGSNNWITTGAANVPSEWKGTLQGTDPGFAGFGTGDLRPAAGSVLINAAAAVSREPVARPVQAAMDIGAYEAGTVAAIGQGRAPGGKKPRGCRIGECSSGTESGCCSHGHGAGDSRRRIPPMVGPFRRSGRQTARFRHWFRIRSQSIIFRFGIPVFDRGPAFFQVPVIVDEQRSPFPT